MGGWRNPALWPAGGRADGRRDLAFDRPDLHGVRRVCAAWRVARSSFYDARCQEERPPERPTGRPGPKPALTDVELLAAIRRDLDRSPWSGEGHRKVWARLRVIDGIRVSRSRVLRVMGENHLLSPHRRPPRPANDHNGSITTAAPNDRLVGRSRRNLPSTRLCEPMSRSDWPASSLLRAELLFSARPCPGKAAGMGGGRTGGGPRHGARSRSLGACPLTFRTMRRCASAMKPSIRRCSSKPEARCAAS